MIYYFLSIIISSAHCPAPQVTCDDPMLHQTAAFRNGPSPILQGDHTQSWRTRPWSTPASMVLSLHLSLDLLHSPHSFRQDWASTNVSPSHPPSFFSRRPWKPPAPPPRHSRCRFNRSWGGRRSCRFYRSVVIFKGVVEQAVGLPILIGPDRLQTSSLSA